MGVGLGGLMSVSIGDVCVCACVWVCLHGSVVGGCARVRKCARWGDCVFLLQARTRASAFEGDEAQQRHEVCVRVRVSLRMRIISCVLLCGSACARVCPSVIVCARLLQRMRVCARG